MINTKNFLLCITLVLIQTTTSFAYEVKSKTSNSYIFVRESEKNAFEVLFCQQGASECITLGGKKTYTMQELNSLKTTEYKKAGLTGAGAAATILTGAWLGAVGGGILGLKYLASSAAINTAIGGGAVVGVVITSTGISLMDKLNPLKHYKTAKMVSKMDSDSVDYVNDIDSQAVWLHSRLNLIK